MKHALGRVIRYGRLGVAATFRPLKMSMLPDHVQIEVTTYCNQDCLSCGRRSIIDSPKHMKLSDFIAIYDQIRPGNINLSGLGEPLLNPDIFAMIEYARRGGSVVNFPTNLTLNETVARKLVETGIHQIKVSIDAVSRSTYLTVRQSDKFDNVKRNIEYINRMKRERSLRRPEIRINFALQRHNMDELPALMEFAHQHGIDTVYVQDLNYFSVETEKPELCGFSREGLVSILDKAEGIARKYRIRTNIVNWRRNMDELFNKTLPVAEFEVNDRRCLFPWVSVFIDVHGNVKPCPVFVWDKDAKSLGNCLEREFGKIWNSEAYRQLRKEFRNNIRRHPVCKRCVPPNLFDMRLIFQKMLLQR